VEVRAHPADQEPSLFVMQLLLITHMTQMAELEQCQQVEAFKAERHLQLQPIHLLVTAIHSQVGIRQQMALVELLIQRMLQTQCRYLEVQLFSMQSGLLQPWLLLTMNKAANQLPMVQ
jgi:hypothetical protein